MGEEEDLVAVEIDLRPGVLTGAKKEVLIYPKAGRRAIIKARMTNPLATIHLMVRISDSSLEISDSSLEISAFVAESP